VSPRPAGAAVHPDGAHGVAPGRGRPRPGPADERPELDVVRAASPRRRSWQVGTLAGAVLFLALFAIAGAQALIVQRQQHLDAVDARIEAAEQEAEQLRDDIAELQSPERIKEEAIERLGMVQAPPPVYLQPTEGDDARAAELPAASPTTTVGPTSATTAGAGSATAGGTGR